MSEFLTPPQAWQAYDLAAPTESEHASPADRSLAEFGLAKIAMPLTESDFKRLAYGYEACILDYADLLKQTAGRLDYRLGNEYGYERKNVKVNAAGRQISDPKNLFHFTEQARAPWNEQFANSPAVFRTFLEDGYAIHDELLSVARRHITDFAQTHPNIDKLYLPEGTSLSFMRLLSYDGYVVNDTVSDQVAKPHYDIGGFTLQAFADAPGFWAAPDGPRGLHTPHDTRPGEAYAFTGKAYEKVYGEEGRFNPLWHGVDRIIPEHTGFIPNRHAVILFVDPPYLDHQVRPQDTIPYA